MEIKNMLSKLIRLVHQLLIYFILLGVFLPNKYLFFYLITWPLIYLHWQFNSNKCALTQLEYWIQSIPYPKSTNSNNTYPFVRSISGNLFTNTSNDLMHKIIISCFTLFWFVGLIRYIYL